MMVKIHLVLLFLIITILTGVCPQGPRETYVKAGEMVVLQCPLDTGSNHDDAKLIWTSHTTQDMDLATNTTSVDQRQITVLAHGRSLVILNATVNNQGNYSCSMGDGSRQFWFRVTVYTTNEYEGRTTYPEICYAQEPCTLHCPDANTPAANTMHITSNGIIWHKEGKPLPTAAYFSSVEENDSGVYICTRSYLYSGQIHNMTFTVVLNVQPKKKLKEPAKITAPHMGQVFHINLGSAVVIDCKAVMYSDFDEVFWLSGTSFVEKNDSVTVVYNYTHDPDTEEIKVTASLVFKKVSEEELSKNYTCKLETESQPSSFVTITLAQKASPFPLSLALSIVLIMVGIAATVLVYLKLKMDITLFLRDTLGFYRTSSDGKSYDAFLMCYKSDTDAGLNEDDRDLLKRVLEERFGYSLCLDDCDISPGKVLECIEQSRTLVLVPTSSVSGPGSGLLNNIHEALMEQQTRLVFIKTETTEVLRSGSLPEALQLLSEAGHCVTWKGPSSMPPSSSFWKQLRYYLPPMHSASKMRLLPQTDTQDGNC
ncbi:interleukin-1 receptor type 1-like [Symphorus nematophorus]